MFFDAVEAFAPKSPDNAARLNSLSSTLEFRKNETILTDLIEVAEYQLYLRSDRVAENHVVLRLVELNDTACPR